MIQRMRGRTGSLRQSLFVGLLLAALLLLLWAANAFIQVQLSLNNTYFVQQATTSNVVIVALDDASMGRFGRTPGEWSRAVYADFLDQIAAANPRVLAFDLIFSEPDAADALFADALVRLRENDARTRVVMAAAGANVPSLDVTQSRELVYSQALLPVESIGQSVQYLGVVNAFPDADTRVRRQPSLVTLEDQNLLSFSLTTYFAYLRIPASAIESFAIPQPDGLLINETTTPPLVLPVDERGLWEQNFFGPPSTGTDATFAVVSFTDVIDGNFDPAIFEDRIVVLGLVDAIGVTDRYPVPSSITGGLMSGVEVQANAIETLLQPAVPYAQPRVGQALMIVALTLLATYVYAPFHWLVKIGLWAALVALFFVAAFVMFMLNRQTLNLFYGLLALSLPLFVSIGMDITREIGRRQRSEFLLRSMLNVSEQRMVLPRIMDLLLKDVQTIMPGTHIRAEVIQPNKEKYQASAPADTPHLAELKTLGQQGRTAAKSTYQREKLVVPIVRQGQVLGTVAVRHARGRAIPAQQYRLLQDMLEQVAPDIENAMLHSTIDQQNALLERILQGSPAGILVTDHAFVIQRSNEQIALFLGLQPDEPLVGRSVLDLLADSALAENAVAELRSLFAAGAAFHKQTALQQRALQLVAAPLEAIQRWVLVFSDVSELVALNQLKTHMIRMASHDLKNPLARIQGYGELILMNETMTEQDEKFLRYMLSSGKEMENIINDILSLEHLRSGEMERTSIVLNQLVREIVSRHEPDFDGKQQTLTVNLPEEHAVVIGDTRTLGQAISNVVSNANKYTPEGGRIGVRLTQVAGQAMLTIEDNGLGIPADSQSKIFQEFYRAKTRATANISGTGLGLSLVKEVVEQHGGSVWFDSEEGKGTKFYISLPLAKDVPVDASVSEATT